MKLNEQVRKQQAGPTNEKSRESVGALWKKTSRRGTQYLSGMINGVAIVVFPVTDKRGPQSPDYRIFRSEAPPAAGGTPTRPAS
jgi:uncharacterized protein (DUF736 family)